MFIAENENLNPSKCRSVNVCATVSNCLSIKFKTAKTVLKMVKEAEKTPIYDLWKQKLIVFYAKNCKKGLQKGNSCTII